MNFFASVHFEEWILLHLTNDEIPYLKVDEMLLLVPVVQLGGHHLAGGDGHPLVGVAVDDVDVLVAVGREHHGELPAVLGEDGRLVQLHPAAGLGHDEAVLAGGHAHVAHRHDRVVLMPAWLSFSDVVKFPDSE